MHSYASDSKDRQIAHWIIAGSALGITYLYVLISRSFAFIMPWWIETPSIMVVYGVFRWTYDTWLWRQSILGFRFSQIPDCNGTWYGELHSSHGGGTKTTGMLIVNQTWTKTSIQFRTDSSVSYSRMASLNVLPGPSQGLVYEYTNDPSAKSVDTMHAHRGLAFLKLSIDGKILEGDYYTGRDRGNHGSMYLRLLCRALLELEDAKMQYSSLKTKGI